MQGENFLKSIKSPKLFLVEGKDDVDFFVKLLEALSIKNCFVWSVEGKDDFGNKLKTLSKVPGFDRLTHFAIIRDKESDNALESVQKILSDINIENIPSRNGEVIAGNPTVGIFILPGTNKGKMLEDLCLHLVQNDPAMRCVEEFACCISELPYPPKNMSKARLLAFLASRREPVNTIGVAANKGYWNFDCPVIDELKEFLMYFK